MQRILMAALPLFLFAASGCDFFQHKEKFYTYCDATGCYTCDQNGCANPVGVPTGLAVRLERPVRLGLLLRRGHRDLRRGRLLLGRCRLYGRHDL